MTTAKYDPQKTDFLTDDDSGPTIPLPQQSVRRNTRLSERYYSIDIDQSIPARVREASFVVACCVSESRNYDVMPSADDGSSFFFLKMQNAE